MNTKNTYKVPVKQWRKWGGTARQTFNELYETFIGNQKNVNHPKAPAIKDEHWDTLVWNFAWLAADNMEKSFII